MEQLALPPSTRASGCLTLPGSKSISNRTLLLAALSAGDTRVCGLLDADDVSRMLEALEKLGVTVRREGDSRDFVVTGSGGRFPAREADLFLGNAGTAFRPLTAALALMEGHYRLSGVPRMHERPIGDLVDALAGAGAAIRYEGEPGYPPLSIAPATVRTGAVIPIRGNVSSQFLTALLMALPLTSQAATVEVVGELISKPYIEITLKLMARFGVTVSRDGWQRFHIAAGQGYKSPGVIHVEGDASSASYFLAAGAIAGGPVRVEGVGQGSIQGDVRFAEVLEAMGATIRMGENWIEAEANGPLTAIDVDLNHIPDAAMTIAVAALAAKGTTTTPTRRRFSWKFCSWVNSGVVAGTKYGSRTTSRRRAASSGSRSRCNTLRTCKMPIRFSSPFSHTRIREWWQVCSLSSKSGHGSAKSTASMWRLGTITSSTVKPSSSNRLTSMLRCLA